MSTEHNRANKTCKMMDMYISVFVVFFFFFFLKMTVGKLAIVIRFHITHLVSIE